MKLLHLVFFSIIFSASLSAYDDNTYLIQNMDNIKKIPRNFRSTHNNKVSEKDESVSLMGLKELKASGSAQFSENSLKEIKEAIPHQDIVIVDLREEPHAILNGRAITWFSHNNWTNMGLTKEKIDQDLSNRIENHQNAPPSYLYKNKYKEGTIPVSFEYISTEQEMVENLGFGYARITATDRIKPSDDAVDDFVSFVKSLKGNEWLHFHCSAGRGRTTTFMALYDIMKNGKDVSLEDIVKRHELLGGVALFKLPDPDSWQYNHVVERAELVRQFYQYVNENPDFDIGWKEWLNKN